jgi:hypothetical protein
MGQVSGMGIAAAEREAESASKERHGIVVHSKQSTQCTRVYAHSTLTPVIT